MTVRYAPVRPDDAVLRDRMEAIAHQRRRFGYNRIHVLLKRDGLTINHKRLFRLYREEKLSVRKRPSRHLLRNCLSGNGRPQTRPWYTRTHACAASAEPKMVVGFCLGSVYGLPKVQGSDGD